MVTTYRATRRRTVTKHEQLIPTSRNLSLSGARVWTYFGVAFAGMRQSHDDEYIVTVWNAGLASLWTRRRYPPRRRRHYFYSKPARVKNVYCHAAAARRIIILKYNTPVSLGLGTRWIPTFFQTSRNFHINRHPKVGTIYLKLCTRQSGFDVRVCTRRKWLCKKRI